MAFENVHLVPVLLAGFAAWILGFVYYSALSKPYKAGLTPEQLEECKNRKMPFLPFVLCLLGAILMAYVLSVLLNYVGQEAISAKGGAVSAFFVWLGFTLPPTLINGVFAKRHPQILAIDSIYWLLALVLQGALLGAFASGAITLPF